MTRLTCVLAVTVAVAAGCSGGTNPSNGDPVVADGGDVAPDGGNVGPDGGNGGPDAGESRPCHGDNLATMSAAEDLVHGQYPNFLLIDVGGKPATGTALVADDFDVWSLFFVPNDGSGTGFVSLNCRSGTFDDPVYTGEMYMGVETTPIPRTMSLSGAIDAMRAAGYADRIDAVSINAPLVWPREQPHYTFIILPDKAVMVDIATGAVTTQGFGL